MAAVISKARQEKLLKELRQRFVTLSVLLEGRPLNSPTEGLRKGNWVNPDTKVAIEPLELSLALGDFKTILAELGKIK